MSSSVKSHSILLSAMIALTSYVPFEWVAKSTLVVSLMLFMFDPFPPNSRLMALLSCAAVLYLNRWYQHSLAAENEDVTTAGVSVVNKGEKNDDDRKEKKKKEQ